MQTFKLTGFEITIRGEIPADEEPISRITRAAFEDHPYSRQTEEYIITALRKAGALTLSLVAELDRQVVGHIAFSPINTDDESGSWYGAGPFSVEPALQRQGIGKALISEGLRQLKLLNAAGCILVGDPDYYKRFGFSSFPGLSHDGVPQENVLALSFTAAEPRGKAVFHRAFSATK